MVSKLAIATNLLRSIAVLAAVVSASSSIAQSKVDLVRSENNEVCTAYHEVLQVLQSQTRGRAGALHCDRTIPENFSNFQNLDWKAGQFTLRDSGALARINAFRWRRDVNPQLYLSAEESKVWKGTKRETARARQHFDNLQEKAFLFGNSVADFDIDNDGVPDPIYLDRECGGSSGTVLLILNRQRTNIDYKRSLLTLRHPTWQQLRNQLRLEFAGDTANTLDPFLTSHYSVFAYRGTSYFDYWSKLPAKSASPAVPEGSDEYLLRVFSIQRNSVAQVCKYRVIQ